MSDCRLRSHGPIDSEERQCLICCEPTTASSSLILPTCSHIWCHACIFQRFNAAIETEANYPVFCCNPQAPVQLSPAVDSVIGRYMTSRFLAKKTEYNTQDKTYCHVPSCSTFINPATIKKKLSKCQCCRAETCSECKKAYHGTKPCDKSVEKEDGQFEAWCEDKKTKKCPKCQRVVERESGCNHINCICGEEFCYACGKNWRPRTCACPMHPDLGLEGVPVRLRDHYRAWLEQANHMRRARLAGVQGDIDRALQFQLPEEPLGTARAAFVQQRDEARRRNKLQRAIHEVDEEAVNAIQAQARVAQLRVRALERMTTGRAPTTERREGFEVQVARSQLQVAQAHQQEARAHFERLVEVDATMPMYHSLPALRNVAVPQTLYDQPEMQRLTSNGGQHHMLIDSSASSPVSLRQAVLQDPPNVRIDAQLEEQRRLTNESLGRLQTPLEQTKRPLRPTLGFMPRSDAVRPYQLLSRPNCSDEARDDDYWRRMLEIGTSSSTVERLRANAGESARGNTDVDLGSRNASAVGSSNMPPRALSSAYSDGRVDKDQKTNRIPMRASSFGKSSMRIKQANATAGLEVVVGNQAKPELQTHSMFNPASTAGPMLAATAAPCHPGAFTSTSGCGSFESHRYATPLREERMPREDGMPRPESFRPAPRLPIFRPNSDDSYRTLDPFTLELSPIRTSTPLTSAFSGLPLPQGLPRPRQTFSRAAAQQELPQRPTQVSAASTTATAAATPNPGRTRLLRQPLGTRPRTSATSTKTYTPKYQIIEPCSGHKHDFSPNPNIHGHKALPCVMCSDDVGVIWQCLKCGCWICRICRGKRL